MNVFESSDYKEILRFHFKEKRKQQKGLSRKLAEYLGVHPTLVSQVLTGSKDFTEEQILLVCEFLGVSGLESKYLLALVQWERAGSKKLKDHFLEVITAFRQQALQVSQRVPRDRHMSEIEKAIFYSSWVYSAVHMLTTLEKPVTFENICERLSLLPKKAREILDFLVQAHLVIERDGVFRAGAQLTHIEKSSPFLLKHHSNWRLKAIEACENLKDEELMYSANVSLSQKDFAILREELMRTIENFLQVVKLSPAEDIAQFNLDFFWIKK